MNRILSIQFLIQTGSATLYPDAYSVLNDDSWVRLRDSAQTGIMFLDEFDVLTMLPISSFETASCFPLSSANSLANQEYDYLWHDESSGCGGSGSDYSLILLTSLEVNGASLYLDSGYGFSPWGYGQSYSYASQDELWYYIK